MSDKDPKSSKPPTPIATPQALAVQPEALLVKVKDEHALASAMADVELAPQFLVMESGDMLEGILAGAGEVESTDDETGQPKMLKTWIVRHASGVLVEFLSAHELSRALTPRSPLGKTPDKYPWDSVLVRIFRGPDERVGKRMVTRYVVGFR